MKMLTILRDGIWVSSFIVRKISISHDGDRYEPIYFTDIFPVLSLLLDQGFREDNLKWNELLHIMRVMRMRVRSLFLYFGDCILQNGAMIDVRADISNKIL